MIKCNDILKMLRVNQWGKNLILFAPPLFAHKIHDLYLFSLSCLAFLSFSFCASSVYILNDCVDQLDDKEHPIKKFRPIASGKVSKEVACLISIFLWFGAIVISLFNGMSSFMLLLVYSFLNLAYSFILKKLLFGDVVCLISFFGLRLAYAGSFTGISVSIWLWSVSICIFAWLAFLKRWNEVRLYGKSFGKAYSNLNQKYLFWGVIVALVGHLIFFPFYLGYGIKHELYFTKIYLILAVVIFSLWSLRISFLVLNNKVNRDPVDYILNSKTTFAVGFLIVLLILGGSW